MHGSAQSMKNRFNTFAEAYQKSVQDVLLYGHYCEPISDKKSVGSHFGKKKRGTKEIISYSFCVKNPRARNYYSKIRQSNLVFNHANFIWTLSGGGQVEGISHYNPRGKLFAKNSAFYEAAFGARLFYPYQQLRLSERRLMDDRASRRALSMIYVPEDTHVDKLDTPCATYLHFMIRNNSLICICNMRSQSALMVLPYDFFLFSMIQELLAVRLGIELGEMIYTSNSFHIYDDELELATAFSEADCEATIDKKMESASDKDIVALVQAEQASRLKGSPDLELLDQYWRSFFEPIQEHNLKT